MPMSLKCIIGKWLHKGQISQEEYDAVIKKLEGHDKVILEKILSCSGCKHERKWEDLIEYGYPSPCIQCSRRCLDHYEANKED